MGHRHCQRATLIHGGLTPAAPARCDAHGCWRNCDFCDARTHVHKSGGREPAVVREPHRQPRLRTRAVAGAASAVFRAIGAVPLRMGFRKPRGLTPRSCFRAGMCVVTSSAFRLSNHGGLTPPALVRACSPAGEIATFAMHERTFTGAAGVSPLWVGNRTGSRDCVHVHVRSPRGGPRAADVSPLWVG